MRKKILIIGISMMLGMLGGCIQNTPLTDSEMDAVAEYAAMLLLRYDSNYDSVLYYGVEAPIETPTPTPYVPEQDKKPDNQDISKYPEQNDKSTNEQLTDIMAVKDFTVTYESCEVTDSVIRNEYFDLSAGEGKQYVVVNFLLHNNTDKKLVFDASKNELEYSLDVNTGKLYRVSLSTLQNDMQYMPIEVAANGTAKAVLVFEIEKTQINTMHLIMKNKSNETVFVKLQ